MILAALTLLSSLVSGGMAWPQTDSYDVVIVNGRTVDPESELDVVQNVGITGDVVRALTKRPLTGRVVLDAQHLVVAPGFIDLHQAGQTPETDRLKVRDGVTTALDVEIGTDDVDGWYARQKGRLLNYGVSAGHVPARVRVMGEPGPVPKGHAAYTNSSREESTEVAAHVARGLQRGAPAVGLAIGYTPAASPSEVSAVFDVAHTNGASVQAHMRGGDRRAALRELLEAARTKSVRLNVLHIQSSGGSDTDALLGMITEASEHGVDVTSTMYPYTGSATRIEAAVYSDWQTYPEERFRLFLWPRTGERLTRETFGKYRQSGGLVILFSTPESAVLSALRHPLTMIGSDGLNSVGQTGHPRTAGTFARVLGRYVREQRVLTLMEALRKMTLMPAQCLERRVPEMRNKGRLRVGANADLTVFDPAQVRDAATYQDPSRPSIGIVHVLVAGTIVVRDGKLQDVAPSGRPVRAPIE
jgi:N-acyl-D-aspartate/D-glutamate deacylase